jgi:putative aldouronate transport system permease protein
MYPKTRELKGRITVKKNIYYFGMLALPIVYFIIFKYGPMSGAILAFKRFVNGQGLWGGSWVGFKYFRLFMNDQAFWRAFRNNLVLSALSILIGFPIPVIFALLLNEVNNAPFKKLVQTVSYLPHFISVVVVAGMIKELLSPSTGIVNTIITGLGFNSVFFLNIPELFKGIYISSDIWQHMGWNAIIYLAALSNIDPQLYEAARIDGANRWKQTWAVTVPGIMPAIIITLILSIGRMLFIGFEKILLLYNPLTREAADILSTYVYRMGLEQGNFSYGTAVGLFNAVIGLVLVGSANMFARKFSDTSLW